MVVNVDPYKVYHYFLSVNGISKKEYIVTSEDDRHLYFSNGYDVRKNLINVLRTDCSLWLDKDDDKLARKIFIDRYDSLFRYQIKLLREKEEQYAKEFAHRVSLINEKIKED